MRADREGGAGQGKGGRWRLRARRWFNSWSGVAAFLNSERPAAEQTRVVWGVGGKSPVVLPYLLSRMLTSSVTMAQDPLCTPKRPRSSSLFAMPRRKRPTAMQSSSHEAPKSPSQSLASMKHDASKQGAQVEVIASSLSFLSSRDESAVAASPVRKDSLDRGSHTHSSTSSEDGDVDHVALADPKSPPRSLKTRARRRNRSRQHKKQVEETLPTAVMNSHTSASTRQELESTLNLEVNGTLSPVSSPRSIRNSLQPTQAQEDAMNGTRKSITTAKAAAHAAQSSQRTHSNKQGHQEAKNSESRQSQASMQVTRSPSGPSGAEFWVHQVLSAHYRTLQAIGLERSEFPNARLSLKQLDTLLKPVIALCNQMKPEQFGIRPPQPQLARQMNDVHYWKLWESDTVDMGIFFMPPNSVIPLHNHPGMSVVSRILYGCASVTSYDLIASQDNVHESQETSDQIVQKQNIKWARVSRQGDYVGESTMWLDPRRFNLHQIHANSSIGCALLDIMIPPYDNADRDCHHFQILEEQYNRAKNERIIKMLESITPDNHNDPGHSEVVPTTSSPPSETTSPSSP